MLIHFVYLCLITPPTPHLYRVTTTLRSLHPHLQSGLTLCLCHLLHPLLVGSWRRLVQSTPRILKWDQNTYPLFGVTCVLSVNPLSIFPSAHSNVSPHPYKSWWAAMAWPPAPSQVQHGACRLCKLDNKTLTLSYCELGQDCGLDLSV